MKGWKLKTLSTLIAMSLAEPAIAFDYVDQQVQADQAMPSVCLTFDGALLKGNGDTYRSFVALDPATDHGLIVRGKDLCLNGLQHGAHYSIALKAGLPAADKSTLAQTIHLNANIPDREAQVSFAQGQDILPYAPGNGVPLRSVNVGKADITLYRLGARALVDHMDDYWFGSALSGYQAESLRDSDGEQVFAGTVDIALERNKEITTSLPIERLVPSLRPGLYVMMAKIHGADVESYEDQATQWFSISDIGLFTAQGADRMLLAARSLQTAKAQPDVALELVARNNEILGRFTTDANGRAEIPAALLRGTGGNAPKIVVATASRGDFTYLPLDKPALDLSDLDLSGRPPPGPLDAYLWTDRGVYRPGETIHLAALLRNERALPVAELPLSLRLIRPDGIEADHFTLDLKTADGGSLDIAVPDNAYTGTWTIEADAGGVRNVGSTSVAVEDFVPPRLEVKASIADERPQADEPIALSVDARYFYGAPGASLSGTADLTIRQAANPFPGLSGYSFGLAQEPFLPQQAVSQTFKTGDDGQAAVTLAPHDVQDTTAPLEAAAAVSVFDIDGRPAETQAVAPLHTADRYIGIKPAFAGALPEQADATFDIALIDQAGQGIGAQTLRYDLLKETYDYTWFRRDGRWEYEESVSDTRANSGDVLVDAQGRAKIAVPVTTGRWRLEVYDQAGNTASSVRFGAGWWADAATSGAKPEVIPVTIDANAPKDVLRARIEPSFDAHVLVMLAGASTQAIGEFEVKKGGQTIEMPGAPIPPGGAYLVAVAFGPSGAILPRLPVRALGTAWIPGPDHERRLAVTIDAPARIQPDTTLDVGLSVDGVAGQEGFVTVAAVDEAVLQMTAFPSPDPADYYLGRRALGMELRDVYNRLIDPAGVPGNIVSGGDARARLQIGNLDVKTFKTVALFSGSVHLDAAGKARVALPLPDFSGRLRLMAVAWTAERFGKAEARTEVRPPLLAELALPRFLAPGDQATLRAAVTALEAPEQTYAVDLRTEGPISLARNDILFEDVKHDRRRFADRVLTVANATGVGRVVMTVKGADGSRTERSFEIPIRSPNSYITRRQVRTLAPGQSLTLDDALAADFLPGTASADLTASSLPAFDVAGLLASLRRYPYGCAEQTVSRAFPELFASILQPDGNPGSGPQGAIARLMSLENAGGGFGYWSAYDNGSIWLTAYAFDFLQTAAGKGIHIPDALMTRTGNWLEARFSALGNDPRAIAEGSYAALVLARAGRLDLSRLRYFALRAQDRMPSNVARVELAAALARLGDKEMAERLLAGPPVQRPDWRIYLADYGSTLRDEAMALSVAAQEKLLPNDRLATLAEGLSRAATTDRWLSTQEQIWLLRAAADLTSPEPLNVEIDGRSFKGVQSTTRSFKPGTGQQAVLHNSGQSPVYAALSLTGIPVGRQPAEANGFTLERRYYTRNGAPADLANLHQNDQLVVVLEGSQSVAATRQALVVDMLPAGLEPETVGLANSQSTDDMAWLGDLATPAFTAARDDRYVAAVQLGDGTDRFKLAYLVRAVTPGTFVQPGAQVEDMYAPEFHARTEGGTLAIAAARSP